MALAFAIGSLCFLVGPFPGYLDLVGPTADAVTFFVGSVFFTVGGGLQTWLAAPERRTPGAGRSAWWAAVVQSAGTLFFNVTTFAAFGLTRLLDVTLIGALQPILIIAFAVAACSVSS